MGRVMCRVVGEQGKSYITLVGACIHITLTDEAVDTVMKLWLLLIAGNVIAVVRLGIWQVTCPDGHNNSMLAYTIHTTIYTS